VPLALDRLEAEPFLEATFYRGDLLRAVLALGDGFWRDHPEALRRARSVVARADAQLAGLGPVDQEAAAAALAAVPPLLREETIG
jgi:hypothetical protein